MTNAKYLRKLVVILFPSLICHLKKKVMSNWNPQKLMFHAKNRTTVKEVKKEKDCICHQNVSKGARHIEIIAYFFCQIALGQF